MDFVFTLGDFLTLAAAVGLLVAYRFIDRNNRSLEKVKKYADKLQDGIAEYADSRAEDLKRYGIELDVKQQAAKEVLKRVKEVEEGLNSRAGAIGQIEQRIAEYDKALSALMDMTSRVDANLERLHEDYEFVEKAAKKLDEAHARLEGLERGLSGVREEFKAQNEAALGEAMGEARALMREGVETTRARYLELEAALQKAFERARTEAEKLEDAAFLKLKENTLAKAGKLQDAIDEKFKALQEGAKGKIAETQDLIKGFKGEWQKDAESMLGTAHAETELLREKLESRLDALDGRLKQAENLHEDRFERVEEKVGEAAKALQARMQEQLKATRDEALKSQAELKASVQAAQASLKEELAALQAEAEAGREGLEKSIAAIPASLADAERRAVEGFDARVADYRKDAERRFAQLEAVQADVATYESGLREAIKLAEGRLNAEFALFGRELQDREKAFAQSFEAEVARIRGGMGELEQGLNSLKSQAYANVSEKLKVFEDEFFADLKRRSDSFQRALDGWKEGNDKALAELAEASKADREATERAYADSLRSRVAELSSRAQEQLGKLETQVDAHADALRERVGKAEESLAELKSASDASLSEAKQSVGAHVRAEIERFRVEHEEATRAARKALEETLEALKSAVDSERAALRASGEENEARLKEYKAGLDSALSEARAELKQRLEALETSSSGAVAALRDDFESQKESLVEASRQDRDRIARELDATGSRIDQLRQELVQRSGQALDQFTRSYESLLADVSKKTRDTLAEADSRAADFKLTAEEFRAKVDASRMQVLSRVEADAKLLSQSVADADKQIKAFVAQTKLFEKADELKAKLGEEIEGLKAEIARIEAKRGDVTELESQLTRVKRLEEEVAQKVARFQSEKRRFDAMEEDFKKLLAIAQSVDAKLEQVRSSDDAVTEVQANMRKLLELSTQAEQKFDRMEKKANVIEVTSTAVDKNFQDIQALEKRAAKIDDSMKDVPDRIIEIKRSLGAIEESRGRIDDAVKRIGEIETMIKDAETRAAALQKAREWLAKAETRFEELNRQSDEQLALLKTLLKEEGGKKERGAPPSSAQEMVRKLARQGWNVEEIAAATKLSRGEVELILELGKK
jgi:DNA repair exonuclease SbcCD ATPase subunit